jgi:hypothetical protein
MPLPAACTHCTAAPKQAALAASLVEAGIAAHSSDSHTDSSSPPTSTASSFPTTAPITTAKAKAPPLYSSAAAADVEAQSLRTSAAVRPVTTSTSAAATAAATAAAAAARSTTSSTTAATKQHPARDTSSSSGSGNLGVHTAATADMSRSSSDPINSGSSAVNSDNPFTMAWGDGWPKRFPALSAYASRAWCRCELFMATSVPMPPDGTCVNGTFLLHCIFL